jgi:hypothetical protein
MTTPRTRNVASCLDRVCMERAENESWLVLAIDPGAEPTTRKATRATNTRFTKHRSLAGRPFKKKAFRLASVHGSNFVDEPERGLQSCSLLEDTSLYGVMDGFTGLAVADLESR